MPPDSRSFTCCHRRASVAAMPMPAMVSLLRRVSSLAAARAPAPCVMADVGARLRCCVSSVRPNRMIAPASATTPSHG
jgi:hypothetical protein